MKRPAEAGPLPRPAASRFLGPPPDLALVHKDHILDSAAPRPSDVGSKPENWSNMLHRGGVKPKAPTSRRKSAGANLRACSERWFLLGTLAPRIGTGAQPPRRIATATRAIPPEEASPTSHGLPTVWRAHQ